MNQSTGNQSALPSEDCYSPTPDMEFGSSSIMSICCYSVVFVFSAVGNVTMLLILLKSMRRAKMSRVYTLFLNLNLADLLVTFFHLPKEIAHAATVQWLGPDWLCRLSKYLDVFGIYLSSNFLICMCVDRFMAILRPLYSVEARRKVNMMLVASWIAAALTSLPQVFTFCVAQHPVFQWYSQCISAASGACDLKDSTKYVLFNTILNALEIYLLPFVAIVICYGGIMWKIVGETRKAKKNNVSADNTSAMCCLMMADVLSAETLSEIKVSSQSARTMVSQKDEEKKTDGSSELSASGPFLRRSDNIVMNRAKSKTLKMTIVVVVTFLICWTPYFIMVAIHFLDLNFQTGQRLGRIYIDPMAEKFLYIFAIFNSCINPYVYGTLSFDLRKELHDLFHIP